MNPYNRIPVEEIAQMDRIDAIGALEELGFDYHPDATKYADWRAEISDDDALAHVASLNAETDLQRAEWARANTETTGLNQSFAAIDRAIAEIEKQADEARARDAANAPFISRASAIVEANGARITGHGMSGAGQMFDHLFGAGVNKKLAAECLIASRRNRTRGGKGCRLAAARYLAEAASYRRAYVARVAA